MYKGFQRIRGELLSATFKPKVTFSIDSVTFNTSCVNVFPDTQYIAISIDEKNRRMIIEPCKENDRGSLKFANQKDGKNSYRKCPAGPLCRVVYRFMGWDKTAKYRILGTFLGFGYEQNAFFFNLDETIKILLEQSTTEAI